MPGAMNYPVDVQFGNWDGPAESGFGFGAVTQSPAVTLVSNNYTRCVHVVVLTCVCTGCAVRGSIAEFHLLLQHAEHFYYNYIIKMV